MIPDGQNLFVVDLTYTVPFEQVEPHLDAHMAFIAELLEDGTLLVAGRKVPRTGGVIIATAGSLHDIQTIMSKDPFAQNQVAEFGFTEFVGGTKHPSFP